MALVTMALVTMVVLLWQQFFLINFFQIFFQIFFSHFFQNFFSKFFFQIFFQNFFQNFFFENFFFKIFQNFFSQNFRVLAPWNARRSEKCLPVPIMVFELFKVQKPLKQGKWLAGHFWRAPTSVPVLAQRPTIYPIDRGSKTLQKIFWVPSLV